MINLSSKMEQVFVPNTGAILGEGSKLLLNPENAVDTVNEQNQDEDKGNLCAVN